MTSVAHRVGPLLLAVAILLTGHGLQLTLLPMRAETMGWTATAIAATGSAYFFGFVIGCLVIPSIVATVAHIRTFIVMAALATIALLGVGLFDSVIAWLLLRPVSGFAFAGLYMVIESWLSEAAPVGRRGAVLSLYTMICLVAMLLGQSFLGWFPPDSLKALMSAAIILCIAIVPIGLTRMAAPRPIPRARFSPRVLLRTSQVAVVCVFFGGSITGVMWSVGPLVGESFGLQSGEIGLMMALTLAGGALAQFPLGSWSDRVDRRIVLAVLFLVGAVVGATGWLFAADRPVMLFALMFLVGACSFPIYSLCVATAGDHSELSLIEIASSVLIMNSIGSIVGPLVVAPLLGRMQGAGFFVFVLVCSALGGLFCIYRIAVVDRSKARRSFTVMPKTSPVAALMNVPSGSVTEPEPEVRDTQGVK